jgi:NAD(P)-dependent dehydrogenase (short-subunit alcohol dehydrogenase family)
MIVSERYANKVVLVTAAASGIGAATAGAFAREGARLMVSDINVAGGEALVERLRGRGIEACFLRADATIEEDVERLVRTTVERFGALHVAANIVGDVHPGAAGPEFHLQSLASWEATLAVSLRSTFLSMKHEIAHMIGDGGGAICNVTSLSGLLHVPESGAAYAAAKAGVIRLTKFAAINYAERGVRINCIAPGVTPTPAYFKAGPEGAKMLIERMLEGHAIKRVIEPGEQAAAILWLCSTDAAMVTGHVLAVDGGWSAR